MPTSPVKTRIPLTSFGHLVSEVKKQFFGMDTPSPVQLVGWRKHFNSYSMQGRRNCVLATYAVLTLAAAAVMLRNQRMEKNPNQSLETTNPEYSP